MTGSDRRLDTDPATAVTRRGLLGAVGAASTAALAGCGGVENPLQSEPRLDADRLRKMVSSSPPRVFRPLPVRVEQSHLDDAVARARELLADVPASLTEAQVPNGVVRERLARVRDEARAGIEDAASARTRREAMAAARRARECAAEARGTWAAIDGDLTAERAAERAAPVRDRLAAARDDHRYAGGDPAAALVVHALVEELFGRADEALMDAVQGDVRAETSVLAVGAVAGLVERARASVDDAAYVADRYRASLSAATTLRERFRVASERLVDAANTRAPTSRTPAGIPKRLRETPSAWALESLHFDAADDDWAAELRRDGEPARAVVAAQSRLVAVTAYDGLKSAMQRDDYEPIRTADRVAGIRSDAVDAATRWRRDDAHRLLERHEAAEYDRLVRYADSEFTDLDEDPKLSWVASDVARYVEAKWLLESVYGTAPTVSDAIRS
ncbi:hypothetical protein [Halobaculum sp. D14]|uniref:hypothetical protein n=1 Tax=Halobaculum sp. D14 TaxID=3421642 RepID=UPI003EBE8D1E